MNRMGANFDLITAKGILREGENNHVIIEEYDSIVPLLDNTNETPYACIYPDCNTDLTDYLIDNVIDTDHVIIKQVRFDTLNECLNPANIIRSIPNEDEDGLIYGKYGRRRTIYTDSIDNWSSLSKDDLERIIKNIFNPFFEEDYIYTEIYVYLKGDKS